MLNCKIELSDGSKSVDPKYIIDKVFAECNNEFCYINLYLITEKIESEDGKVKIYYKLNPKNEEIQNFGFSSGVYFILSGDKKKLLYIGKALDIKVRLKAHLIKRANSVSSEMFKILEYLRNNKENSIYYHAIETQEEYNAAIEGVLIDYAISQANSGVERYKDLFNARKD